MTSDVEKFSIRVPSDFRAMEHALELKYPEEPPEEHTRDWRPARVTFLMGNPSGKVFEINRLNFVYWVGGTWYLRKYEPGRNNPKVYKINDLERNTSVIHIYAVRMHELKDAAEGKLRATLIDLIDADLLPDCCEIVHRADSNAPYASVCELTSKTLTEAGRRYWSDVLKRPVRSIHRNGSNGITIVLEGQANEYSMDRVKNFTLALAGHVSNDLYEKWFSED